MGQDTGGVWQRTLVTFLHTRGISYTYWAWNPNSGDTGGILNDDWTSINQSKLNILSAYQWPMLDKSHSGPSNPCGNASAIQNAYQWPPS